MEGKLQALNTIRQETDKIYQKYKIKAEKEREKITNVYVTVQGEKCYNEQSILDWYAADYISLDQCDRYIQTLNKKKEEAGNINGLTKSEKICKILEDTLYRYDLEIFEIKKNIETEKRKLERLKMAQEQGLSYKQWLDLEEVNRQSEDFEKLMEI